MKKKIAALLILIVMICGCVLTSCNNSTEIIEDEDTRRALTITLYCITDEKTTKEAVKKVENAINQITKRRYSTQIVLRFFKESEYDGVIDNLVADIALEEKQKKDDESLSAAAAKESRRRAAIDKLISLDKAEVTTRKLIVWSTEPSEDAEDSEEETYETEQNIFGEDVEKYPDATDTQLDIFLICGTKNLNKYVTEEPYATDDESFLVSMDEMLTLNAKSIKQYVSDTVLLAGKVGSSQYAIPTNKRIAGNSTYLILDRALLKKYGYGEDEIRTLTSAKFNSFLGQVKENETDVIPLRNAPSAPGIISLFDEESIFGTYVANTAVTGFKAIPKNLLSAYQYTDHIVYMDQYRRNGYISDEGDNARYAAQIVTASDDEIEKYDEKNYVVKILGKGMATTDTIGQYMFGISKYTRDPNRCMEIINLISTNSEIRNLLQYGIEGSNYKINTDTGKVERLNHDYMMNIFATGNTFIAYPEEDMELDVWEKDKAANRSAIVSPYLGFLYEKEGNASLIEEMKKLSNSILEQIKNFDVEQQRSKKIEELQKTLDDYKVDADKYKEQLDLVQEKAEGYLARIEEATEALKPYSAELERVKAEIKPYDTKISELKTTVSDLEKQIKAEEKVKPTADKPDLKPDQEKIDGWKKEIEEAQAEIRAQRGYSYELRKELADAQAAYDEHNKIVKDIEAEYDAEKVTGVDSSGKEVEYPLKTAYSARLNNYKTYQGNVDDTQALIDALNAPEQEAIDKEYAELTAFVNESKTEYERMSAEYSALDQSAKADREAVKTAEAELKAAKEAYEAATEAFAEYNRTNSIALSYVEDAEQALAANKDEAKVEQLNKALEDAVAEYDKTVASSKGEKDKYDKALADYNAKKEALDAANSAEVFTKLNDLSTEMATLNGKLKDAQSKYDNFKVKKSEYYDAIAANLYAEFFKNTVTDLEKNNVDYQKFMNIGEDYSDDENGIVAIYNEWYSATYGE